jgi:hypothetical protein
MPGKTMTREMRICTNSRVTPALLPFIVTFRKNQFLKFATLLLAIGSFKKDLTVHKKSNHDEKIRKVS